MNLGRETWLAAPREVRLGGEDVHVWRARLGRDASALRARWEVISPDERQKAERYCFDRDRHRYVAGRGLLRVLLGRYLGLEPARLRFTYNEYGKPSLEDAAGGLRFNVSHSQDAALYAFTRGREVGVDVESLREDFASLEIAEHFFSGAEVRELTSLPEHARTQGFFNCWTRKEAYIKALGQGLSHPLNTFAVSLRPGEPARLLNTDADPAEAARWSIVDLHPFAGYAAALAVRCAGPRVYCWEEPPL